jgi:hypothetical protein
MSFLNRANLLIFYEEGVPKNQRLVKGVLFCWSKEFYFGADHTFYIELP